MTLGGRLWLRTGGGAGFVISLLLTLHYKLFLAPLTVFLGLIFVGSLVERFRYKRLQDRRPGSGWMETDEKFIDPETKKRVTVFYNPASGERLYVAGPDR